MHYSLLFSCHLPSPDIPPGCSRELAEAVGESCIPPPPSPSPRAVNEQSLGGGFFGGVGGLVTLARHLEPELLAGQPWRCLTPIPRPPRRLSGLEGVLGGLIINPLRCKPGKHRRGLRGGQEGKLGGVDGKTPPGKSCWRRQGGPRRLCGSCSAIKKQFSPLGLRWGRRAARGRAKAAAGSGGSLPARGLGAVLPGVTLPEGAGAEKSLSSPAVMRGWGGFAYRQGAATALRSSCTSPLLALAFR